MKRKIMSCEIRQEKNEVLFTFNETEHCHPTIHKNYTLLKKHNRT